jgi:kinesin family member C2/C3
MQEVLARGRKNRTTHSTELNACSSRSHELISLRLHSPPDSGSASSGGPPGSSGTFRRLNLTDLAGSERISRSKVEGQQLLEAQSINKSLSALGDVIAALQAGSPHVPYRNSKLTAVLQDALCGHSKVLLVCNVAPEATEIGETLCSLGFAQRAAQVCVTRDTFRGM